MPNPILMRKLGARTVRTPALTSIVLWLKADGLVLNNNDPIATFTDFSGAGRNLVQAGSGLKPLFKVNQKNGLPAAQFDGTDDQMTGTLVAPTAYSMFMVAKMGNTGGNPTPCRWGTVNDSVTFIFNAGNRCVQHRNGGAATTMADGAGNTTSWEIWSVTCASSGSNPAFKLNGVTQTLTPTNGAFTGNSAFTLGSFTGTLYQNMLFGEILVHNAALSAADRAQTETYLAQKWAIP